jgi:hypothetical protein
LAKILSDNKVHTVISAIQVNAPEAAISELNLVQAAAKTNITKRFIASNWGIPFPPP